MQPADFQQEHNRLSQLYREMADDELENVAAEAYDLTDIAQECLRFEISSRGLKIPLNLTPASDDEPEPLPPSDDGFIPDDRDIAFIYVVHDMEELLKIKTFLDQARIECFLGEDKTRDPKALPHPFGGDLDMFVWRHDFNRVVQVLTANVPGYGKREEAPNLEVRCPKCNSDGVIFEERELTSTDGKPQAKFRWVCDDCGHEWEDEGIAAEAPPE